MTVRPCYIQAVGLLSALGNDIGQTRERLLAGDTSGMRQVHGWLPDGPACVGQVTAALADLPAAQADCNCRNNQLLAAALRQIEASLTPLLARHGAERIGVVLGTSTSGIAAGETAIASKLDTGVFPPGYNYRQQEIGMLAPVAARLLGVTGPAYTVSTACTSGAKALISARNLLDLGLCDVVVAGGVDTLCRLTIGGFTALESCTDDLCNPMSRNRRGINIGEAAALFVLSHEPAAVALAGAGEASDAYHLSAPDPAGSGAEMAIRAALDEAGISPSDIGYVNLHATATEKNDAMESHVMSRIFPAGVATSGTKPMTGHTLGAAGALEAAFCWLTLTGDGRLPPHIWDGVADPALPALRLVTPGQTLPAGSGRYCMSNSFAFGGSNVSLIFSA